MRNWKLPALVLIAMPLCGFAFRPLTPGEQAMVLHATNNDPAWTTLADAQVSEDKGWGLMYARFGPTVSRLKGADFEISGYMTPLEADTRTRYFILTRRDTTCPFCPPNSATEAIEVALEHPVAFTRSEIRVKGRLQLVSTSGAGLFYRLTGATLAPSKIGRSE